MSQPRTEKKHVEGAFVLSRIHVATGHGRPNRDARNQYFQEDEDNQDRRNAGPVTVMR